MLKKSLAVIAPLSTAFPFSIAVHLIFFLSLKLQVLKSVSAFHFKAKAPSKLSCLSTVIKVSCSLEITLPSELLLLIAEFQVTIGWVIKSL
ncbi:Uncharacterised protein [Mycoplasma putrefaciens]|nr:Uncharacterised protein [Mycoplasma putrefaciens]